MKHNKYWNPATFGDLPDDWVKVYTVAIPNLPIFPSKKVLAFLNWIQAMDGYIGLRPEYPRGTLLLFKTMNDAKACKNLIPTYEGYNGEVGNNVGECYIPPQYVK